MLPPDDRPAAHSTSRPVDARRPRAHAAHLGRRLGDRLAPPPLPDEGGGRSLPAPLSLRAQRPVRSGAPAAHPRRSSRLPAHHLPLRGGGGGRAAGAGRGPVPPRLGNRRSEAAQDRLPGAQGDARGPPRGGAGTLVPRPRERGRGLPARHPARRSLHRSAPARRVSGGRRGGRSRGGRPHRLLHGGAAARRSRDRAGQRARGERAPSLQAASAPPGAAPPLARAGGATPPQTRQGALTQGKTRATRSVPSLAPSPSW